VGSFFVAGLAASFFTGSFFTGFSSFFGSSFLSAALAEGLAADLDCTSVSPTIVPSDGWK
jgi:hypothetical protein